MNPRNQWIEWLPGASWMTLMVIPLIWQVSLLPNGACSPFQLPIVIFGAVILLAADCHAAKLAKAGAEAIDPQPCTGLPTPGATANVCIALALLISVVHLALMPSIPVLEWARAEIAGDEAGASHFLARARATKFLPIAPWVDHVSTWSLATFGPIAISLSWVAGRRLRAVAILLWLVAYAMSTTAKFPMVALLSCTALALAALSAAWSSMLRVFVSVLAMAMVACVVLLVLWPSPMFSRGTESLPQQTGSPGWPIGTTLADRHRMWSAAAPEDRLYVPTAISVMERYSYRVVFTPADVAIRWYQYFSRERQPLGYLSVVRRPDPSQRPSSLVARWAYVSRFPSIYRDYANASASCDADAFACGGPVAATLAVVTIFAMRLGVVPLRRGGSVGKAAYGLSIALLCILPFQSSVQSILFVYNVFGLLLLSGYLVKRSTRRALR